MPQFSSSYKSTTSTYLTRSEKSSTKMGKIPLVYFDLYRRQKEHCHLVNSVKKGKSTPRILLTEPNKENVD